MRQFERIIETEPLEVLPVGVLVVMSLSGVTTFLGYTIFTPLLALNRPKHTQKINPTSFLVTSETSM